jgi:maltooligosyltrehalose trehalohydrolase
MPEHVRVWAPRADAVTLVLPDIGDRTDRVPMLPEPGDWWVSTEPLPPGTDYALSLDGGPPRPDPRSPWQPAGVHGPSRTFDTAVHAWGDHAWEGRSVLGAVTYELHVGTFTPTGTLDSAVGRLDHLVDLGVDMVELMPVAAFPGTRGWGYDGVAPWAVHEAYGGPAALQRFVDAAHVRGIAVCLDVVDNHLGPSGNYLNEFGPYFTDRHHTPWGQAVNLDGDDAAEVRAYLIGKALRWFRDFHVDALRLDAVHALADDSEVHVLAELADAIRDLERQLGRPLSLVAESDLNDARMVTPTSETVDGRGGYGMTAQWADDVHHAVHAWITGEKHGYYVDFGSTETLAKALTDVFIHDGWYSTFRGREWGAPVPPDVDGRRFVVFGQNHDQVGNRALGDRPSRVLPPGTLAASAALVLLGPGTPLLFMGEEWGASTPFLYFTDHSEPELGAAVRRGRTAEFGTHGWSEIYGHDVEVPDPQARSTFLDSKLDWDERETDEGAWMFDVYAALVHLRHSLPAVASGDRRATSVVTGSDWLVMTRRAPAPGEGETVDVVVVRAEDGATVPLEASEHRALLTWGAISVDEEAGTVHLPGPGFAVLVRR